MHPRTWMVTGALALALAGWTAPARAAPARADVDAVVKCLEVQDTTARLACFDRTVTVLKAAPPAPAQTAALPPPPPLTPEEKVRRFGAERLEDPAEKKRVEEIRRQQSLEFITAKVVSVKERVPGRSLITLDNGQVWYQVNPDRLIVPEGTVAVVREAIFGSYSMTFENRRGIVKVERVS